MKKTEINQNMLISAFFMLVLALYISLSICQCSKFSKPEKKITVAVMFRNEFNFYFEEMESGIIETASGSGVKTIVMENEDYSLKETEDLIKKLVDLKIKSLIIVPERTEKARKNCIPIILALNRMKVPVIMLHTGIDDELMKKMEARVECLISSDNLKGGRLAGQYIADRLEGKGKVLLLEGDPECYVSVKRRKGFDEVIKNYPAIEVIDSPFTGFNRSNTFLVTRELFKKYPDIKAVFAFSDPMALGVSEAVKISKYPKPLIVGYDGTKEGLKAIKDQRIDATVTQYPYEMGRIAIECAKKLADGEILQSLIYTKTELIKKETMKLPFQ